MFVISIPVLGTMASAYEEDGLPKTPTTDHHRQVSIFKFKFKYIYCLSYISYIKTEHALKEGLRKLMKSEWESYVWSLTDIDIDFGEIKRRYDVKALSDQIVEIYGERNYRCMHASSEREEFISSDRSVGPGAGIKARTSNYIPQLL